MLPVLTKLAMCRKPVLVEDRPSVFIVLGARRKAKPGHSLGRGGLRAGPVRRLPRCWLRSISPSCVVYQELEFSTPCVDIDF